MNTAELIRRLVELHGEGGVSPTAADWDAILQQPSAAPVRLLNLLKFKPEVQTSRGIRRGFEAYNTYASEVAPAFARAGGELLFRGRVAHLFPGASGEDWSLAVLTKYPTPRAVADFWLDPEFIRAHAHRVDGVDRSLVLVFGQ